MAGELSRSCFTCLRETDEFIPMMEEAEDVKFQQPKPSNGTSPCRSTVVAKHFWFDLNDLLQGFLCSRCWSKIEEFHRFYCEIEEAHEHKLSLPFAEVKEELPDVDEEGEHPENEQEGYEESFSQELLESKQEGETTVDGKLEDVTVFMEEEHLLDEEVEEPEEADETEDWDEEAEEEEDDDDDDEEEEVEEKSGKATKVRKRSRKKLKLADRIAQADELIASYCNMHCDQCTLTFDSFNALQAHSASEHQRRAYVFCCDRRFNTRTRLYEHVQRHVNPEQFQCDICKRNCVDSEGLKRHKLKVHTPIEERPFKCDRCSKAFAQESVLNSHKRYHQALEQKEFPCEQCNKYFGNAALLKQHVKNSHTSTFEYVCDHCAKGFNQKGLFLRHLKDHGPKGPEDKAQCPICAQWLLKVSLNKHILRHNSPTYRCETCGKESPNILAHRSHVRFAHSDARFTCNFCGKIFKRALTLKEHIASHSGEVLYTCPHCPKTFNSNANMHSHRKKMHYQEWLETRRRIIVK